MASSTGNIYGIYDLSGGAYEYVAAFDTKGTSWSYSDSSSWAAAGKTSTKWATAYENGTTTSTGDQIYKTSKTGDMTKEVKKDTSSNSSLFTDYTNVVFSSGPFAHRGGSYDYGVHAGVFYASDDNGRRYDSHGFRVALAP